MMSTLRRILRVRDNTRRLARAAVCRAGRVPHPPLGNVRVASEARCCGCRARRRADPAQAPHRAGSLASIRSLALTALSLLALAVAPAVALGASGDAAASDAYVRANYALVRAGQAKLAGAEAALQGLLASIRRECPHVVADSPQNEASEKLTWEIAATMRIVAFHHIAGAIDTFARSVRTLHWSNAGLTRSVHDYARKLNAEATTTAPDFCADLRAWKASGYTKLPAGTLPFVNAFYPVQAVGMLPKRQLAPYLAGGQGSVLARTSQIEGRLLDFEANAVETWGSIMDAVELNP
jgi:hypothetical protein